MLESGGRVTQETRLFDSSTGRTHAMRSKEEAHDYRYFPEPDLPPLVVDAARVQRVRVSMPELPEARRQRFVAAYGIPEYDAGVLTAEAGSLRLTAGDGSAGAFFVAAPYDIVMTGNQAKFIAVVLGCRVPKPSDYTLEAVTMVQVGGFASAAEA